MNLRKLKMIGMHHKRGLHVNKDFCSAAEKHAASVILPCRLLNYKEIGKFILLQGLPYSLTLVVLFFWIQFFLQLEDRIH